tara:strand:+ start:4521 stop:4814 length:294 start_codon:yes stop_codon:yes gene_type:complete
MNIDNLSQAYEIYRDDPKGHTFRTVTIERGGIICEGEFTQVFSALADEFKIPPEVLETYIKERLSLDKKYVEMLFNIECRMNISNRSQAYKIYMESV